MKSSDSNRRENKAARLVRRVGAFITGLLTTTLWLWCLLAISFHPWLPSWLNLLAAISFAIGTIVLFTRTTELEVIGQRTAQSEYPLYLYPIRADQQQLRAMLLQMLRRANDLAEHPEFYDTWTNNCTNNIVVHFNKIAPIHISAYHWRIAFPGYIGGVAYENGLIDSDEPFEAILRRARINDVARDAGQRSGDFSRLIRTKYDE